VGDERIGGIDGGCVLKIDIRLRELRTHIPTARSRRAPVAPERRLI
jgi:hypothetical protein